MAETREYTCLNGLYFDARTPIEVQRALANAFHAGTRVRVWYGDAENGHHWGDIETGYIGRSLGPIQVPLIVWNSRGCGGPAILDRCIVRIDAARKDRRGNRRIFYIHRTFVPKDEPYVKEALR